MAVTSPQVSELIELYREGLITKHELRAQLFLEPTSASPGARIVDEYAPDLRHLAPTSSSGGTPRG